MGKASISITGLNLDRALESINKQGITVHNLRKAGAKQIIFDVDYTKKADVFAIFKNMCYNTHYDNDKLIADGYTVQVLSQTAIKKTLFDNRKRIGLFVGIISALILATLFFTGFWHIQVDGNKRIKDSEIEKILDENGIKKGFFNTTVDIKRVENVLYSNFENIAFVKVYRRGVALVIEVKEKNDVVEIPDSSVGNIYATTFGKVEKLIVYSGTAVVKVGDTVQSGDLLIEGKIYSENKQKAVRASGDVIIRSSYYFNEDTTALWTKNIRTGEYWEQKYIGIFDTNLKISSQDIDTSMCDVEITKEYICDNYLLPIYIQTVRYYKLQPKIIIDNEQEVVLFVLNEKLQKLSNNYEITNITYNIKNEEHVYLEINCEVISDAWVFVGES